LLGKLEAFLAYFGVDVQMHIKLERFERNKNAASKEKLAGWIKVILNDRLFVWLKVLQGKKGIYLKFINLMLAKDNFVPGMGWIGRNMENEIQTAISPELTKLLKEDYIMKSVSINDKLPEEPIKKIDPVPYIPSPFPETEF
jgi:hypothetical protein